MMIIGLTHANDNNTVRQVQSFERQKGEIERLMRNCEAALRRYKFKVVQ